MRVSAHGFAAVYTGEMQTGDDQARAARRLWAGTFDGVLSTHSLEHAGYPFGSVVPYVLDQGGRPLFLLSHLSQHTRNIDVDPRCGLTVAEAGVNDVQQRSRLSAVGEVLAIDGGDDAQRYFDYFPHSRMYFEQLGFRFYRFQPMRFHWNAGFATARWFGAGRILQDNPLELAVLHRIVGHMNADHRVALRAYLGDRVAGDVQEAVEMVGIDAEGIDLRLADRLFRVDLPRPIHNAEDARAILVEMAAQDDDTAG